MAEVKRDRASGASTGMGDLAGIGDNAVRARLVQMQQTIMGLEARVAALKTTTFQGADGSDQAAVALGLARERTRARAEADLKRLAEGNALSIGDIEHGIRLMGWLPMKNMSGVELPPYSPAQIMSWDNDPTAGGCYSVKRPDAEGIPPALILFTWDRALADGGVSMGQDPFFRPAVATITATISTGSVVQTQADSFDLAVVDGVYPSASGFIVMANATPLGGATAYVRPYGGGGGGGGGLGMQLEVSGSGVVGMSSYLHPVLIYGNGYLAPSTGTGYLYVASLSEDEDLPIGFQCFGQATEVEYNGLPVYDASLPVWV